MDPLNAALLQPHLGLAAPVEPDTQNLIARAPTVAAEIDAAWARQTEAVPGETARFSGFDKFRVYANNIELTHA